jgi:hypothetical protein
VSPRQKADSTCRLPFIFFRVNEQYGDFSSIIGWSSLRRSDMTRSRTYRGALFFDRKIRITRTATAKIPATTRIRVMLSIASLHSPASAHAVGNVIPQNVADRMSFSTN